MQLFMEIFYDPYFYDLELSIFSTDAVRVKNQHRPAKVDWSLYKGSKQLFVELESGQYEVKIVHKLPPLSDATLLSFLPNCVAF